MTRLLSMALLSAVAGLAQSPSCDVAGEVVNALNGEALRNAAVSATRPSPGGVVIVRSGTVGGVQTSESTAPAPALTAQTDDQGRFCLSGLPPGVYDLSAKRAGFLDREYDARGRVRPGPQVRIARGSTLEKQVIRLTPQGVVAGRLYDQDGQPVWKATIRLYRMGYLRGQKRMMPAGSSESDNRGEFRLPSVAPGKYYIAALPTAAAAGATMQAPTFYPGTTDLGRATQLEISPGLERSGVDLRLVSTEAFRISGKVLDGAGKPVGRAVISALEPVVLWRTGGPRVMTGEDGVFQLSGVPRGTYSISAYRNPDGYIARQTVEVTGDLAGLEMQSVPGTQVVGSMVFEDGRKLPLDAVRILLQRVDPVVFESVYGEVRADGRFTLANVRPGRYRFNAAGLEDDWYVVAMRGVSTADHGELDFSRGVPGTLEVVLGAAGGRVSGVVRQKEKPLEAAVVALLPVDYERQPHWKLRIAISKRNGEFAITGIAPGEYKFLAWHDVEHGAVEDREFLKERVGRAVGVSVAAGQRIELSPPVVAAQP